MKYSDILKQYYLDLKSGKEELDEQAVDQFLADLREIASPERAIVRTAGKDFVEAILSHPEAPSAS